MNTSTLMHLTRNFINDSYTHLVLLPWRCLTRLNYYQEAVIPISQSLFLIVSSFSNFEAEKKIEKKIYSFIYNLFISIVIIHDYGQEIDFNLLVLGINYLPISIIYPPVIIYQRFHFLKFSCRKHA